VAAWQRLQAARAVEWYQVLVLDKHDLDFGPFKKKLGELATLEKHSGSKDFDSRKSREKFAAREGIPGEGLPGLIDPDEPEAVRLLRARMRVLHHPRSTEETYVGWLFRFISHLDDERVQDYGEPEIGEFLTDLAIVGGVAAGTQNQALCALMFFLTECGGTRFEVYSARACKSESILARGHESKRSGRDAWQDARCH
jgi:hypothetical protein